MENAAKKRAADDDVGRTLLRCRCSGHDSDDDDDAVAPDDDDETLNEISRPTNQPCQCM